MPTFKLRHVVTHEEAFVDAADMGEAVRRHVFEFEGRMGRRLRDEDARSFVACLLARPAGEAEWVGGRGLALRCPWLPDAEEGSW